MLLRFDAGGVFAAGKKRNRFFTHFIQNKRTPLLSGCFAGLFARIFAVGKISFPAAVFFAKRRRWPYGFDTN